MASDLSPDNARYIAELVRHGVYKDEAAALDEAVLLLKKRDALRSDVQAGIAQADRGELLAAEAVFEQLQQRAREIEAAARSRS